MKQYIFITVLLFFAQSFTIMSPQLLIRSIHDHRSLIVYFYKSSCPFCSYLDPLIQKLKKEFQSHIKFIEIDISNAPEYKNQFEFTTVPTIIYYKEGKEILRHGSNQKKIYLTHMQSYAHKLL